MIRVDGIKQVLGSEELDNIIAEMNIKLSPFLAREGYAMQFWFARDPDLAPQMVKDLIRPQRGTANKLGLDLEDLFTERELNLPKYVVWEGFYIALWTRL